MRAWQFTLLLLLAGAAGPAPCGAQSPDAAAELRVSIPFDEWAARPAQSDIPWNVYVSDPELRWNQRLTMGIYVEVQGRPLAKQGERHDLYLMARFADEHGHWIEQGWLAKQITQALPRKSSLTFWMPFVVIPGEYKLVLILYDRTTDRHNVFKKVIRPKPLKNDPLAGAFSSLPRVQFLPPVQGLENYFDARIQSRLALPVKAAQPIHFEILLVMGELEQRGIRRISSYSSLGVAMGTLGVLSQLQVPDATFHLTAVDPMRRNIVYEQKEGRTLDWRPMMKAISQINPGVISAQALEGYSQYVLFLRNIFAERFAERLADRQGRRPLKVVLLIGSPLLFPRGTLKEPILAEGADDALFFHLRYQPFGRRFEIFDDLDRVLKVKNLKRFELTDPRDFREALGEIISTIERQAPGDSRAATTLRPL